MNTKHAMFDSHPEPFSTILTYLTANHPEWYIGIEYGEACVLIYQADADNLEHISYCNYLSYVLKPDDCTGITTRDTILLADKIQEYFEQNEKCEN